MKFLKSTAAQSTVEWLVVVIVLVTALGGLIWAISESLATKLQEYNDAL